MKIRTAGVQDLETVSRIHALSWKTAYRGILPDDFLNQLSYRRWVAPLKDMMEPVYYKQLTLPTICSV